ncbi:hypothetical protein F4778DRAFT_782574 [Xylariomycetidae sp. FL2044]|nr:hypothetical protein F4778DRAFT_782574 [Xylariomycetidae sp. FL2044]
MAPKKKKKPGGVGPNSEGSLTRSSRKWKSKPPLAFIASMPSLKSANAFCADDHSSASLKCVACRKIKKGAEKGGRRGASI